MQTEQKDWPSDCLLIVAEIPGKANVAIMESVNERTCRECGATVLVDGLTLRQATNHKYRFDRPLDFLCLGCLPGYALHQCRVIDDYRRPQRAASN